MYPRKKESKKWSAIPAELAKQIQTVFEESFRGHLEKKTLKVEGRIYPTEILMRIGINNKGELRFQNFEVSTDHSAEKKDTIEQITVAVDAVASLMADYFENAEEHEMPYVWQEYPFGEQKLWLQFSSTNPDLEIEANKLLGVKDETALLVETLEDLEALEIPEDEEIDTSRPKIFRVPTNNPNDALKDTSGNKPKKNKKEDMH